MTTAPDTHRGVTVYTQPTLFGLRDRPARASHPLKRLRSWARQASSPRGGRPLARPGSARPAFAHGVFPRRRQLGLSKAGEPRGRGGKRSRQRLCGTPQPPPAHGGRGTPPRQIPKGTPVGARPPLPGFVLLREQLRS
ncbi:hypothetical protein NN561_005190 [Cricetulus griseus]